MPGKSDVFIFFNCDEHKSEASMNIFYNSDVYKNTKVARKKLWQKVKSEFEEKRVKIDEENLAKVEDIIINGDPVEASEFVKFGAIKSFNCF